jgi:riboflavin synthase
MFTGLVEDTGAVASIAARGGARTLGIRTRLPLADVAIGDSIAVDGVCLTVESTAGDVFTVTAGGETLDRTTVGGFQPGRAVHLERALRVGDRLGGHLVQGHVDGVGAVRSVATSSANQTVWIDAPAAIARYVAEKGSITVDGVSLTVNELDGNAFRVDLIPHTLVVTRFGSYAAGLAVNLEVDVVARYVERLLTAGPSGLTLDKLRANGFAP